MSLPNIEKVLIGVEFGGKFAMICTALVAVTALVLFALPPMAYYKFLPKQQQPLKNLTTGSTQDMQDTDIQAPERTEMVDTTYTETKTPQASSLRGIIYPPKLGPLASAGLTANNILPESGHPFYAIYSDGSLMKYAKDPKPVCANKACFVK